ncbi:unnamed protein product [Arctogadus glacialis]
MVDLLCFLSPLSKASQLSTRQSAQKRRRLLSRSLYPFWIRCKGLIAEAGSHARSELQ